MARDPYDSCPCGSGNKLKFCCADVAADMDKVERLLGNNQPHMAVQTMEKLREAHPDNQWVAVCLASTLINDDQASDAKQILKPILKQHPEQPFANALYALAAYNADGYPRCKRAAQRAFKQSIQAFPDLISTLANAVAESLLNDGKVLAARQYLVIAMRLAQEEHRRILFEDLMELDGDTTIPYPLRGVRRPMEFDTTGAAEKPAKLAARLAAVGCFGEAAETLETIAEGRPDDPRLRYNIGLFHAWDGNNSAAVEQFRLASQSFDDSADAVECEVLAQCLEQTDPGRGTPMRLRRYNLRSVAQLLSKLDQTERFVRVDQSERRDAADADGPAARYVFLNRTIDDDEDFSKWSWDTVPLIEGRVTIFDSDPQGEQPAQAFVVGLEGAELDRTVESFVSAVGDLAEAVEPDAETGEDGDITGHVPEFEMPLRWSGFVPPEAPGEVARQTARQRWDTVISEIWPQQNLVALNGRTPMEAAGDPDSQVALEAAVILFDAYADARNFMLPIHQLRQRLQLPEPSRLPVDEQTHLNSLSNLQIHRLDAAALSSNQYEQLLKRVTLLRHSRLLYDVLKEALQRPDQSAELEARDRILATLAGLCGNSLQYEETLEWIDQGRSVAAERSNAFEAQLEWKMRELTLRIESPDDPRLEELLKDLWHHYGAKLPQLREYLVSLVETAGVKPPWDQAIVASAGAVSGGMSWSQSDSGEPKKLWLPGDAD